MTVNVSVTCNLYLYVATDTNGKEAGFFWLIHCIYFVFLDTNYQGLANMYCCHAKERKMDRYHAIH